MITLVFDRDGKLLYFFSQPDVTRRRSSEQAFRQAQKMECIGQLTAGLAHDFNNLLQVVSGHLKPALSRTQDESLRRPLENANRAAKRGAKLTKQLLAFARKTRLKPKPMNLNTLITEFGDMLENSVGPQIKVELNLRSWVPAALVDPVHLEMAMFNVLINARDAMPKGGTVTVGTSKVHLNGDAAARYLPPGDYGSRTISHEGEGMPPHVLKRATEPFFTTKSRGRQGHGGRFGPPMPKHCPSTSHSMILLGGDLSRSLADQQAAGQSHGSCSTAFAPSTAG